MTLPFIPRGIFTGVRVLDVTRVLAGPYCTLVMSDLGAEVIKIEEPGRGDTSRWIGDADGNGFSSYFNSVNRNKLSVAINLEHDEGRAVFHRLVESADVVVTNFRPTALERLGCDYETLHAIDPRIIACAISGFGQDGPYRDWPAYDLIVQGMGGGMDLTGEPGGEPMLMGLHIGDQAAGLFAAFAIAGALYHRERTGEGQFIDVAMLDCQISLLAFLGQTYLAGSPPPTRTGRVHPVVAPFGALRTEDGYITLAAHLDKFWAALCEVIGKPEWIHDERFANVQIRGKNASEVYANLEPVLATRPTAYWLEKFRAKGIPCGPLNTVPQALDDPHVAHRNMVVTNRERNRDRKLIGNPVKSSAQPDECFGPPPLLGEHTAQVLQELLACSDAEIKRLRAAGAIQ